MIQLLLVLALLIAGAAVVFAFQNPAITVVTFFKWHLSGSLALILLIAFALGFATSFFLGLAAAVRRHWTVVSQRRRIAQLEAELRVFRAAEPTEAVVAPDGRRPGVPSAPPGV